MRRMTGGNIKRHKARIYLKDEGVSPTATFKARGMALAVSMAKQLGLHKLAVPSAGNAGVALAAYASAAGLEALVVAPEDTPPILLREIQARGAKCFLVGGPIDEAGAYIEEAAKAGYTSLATLREPYRVEGKKTMGFELWEQLGEAPDWIVFPTGGGTGVVGLWKAFRELGQLGWTDGKMPRLCAVQSDGCPPLARAWEEGGEDVPNLLNPHTLAMGLKVPRPNGFRLIMKTIKETHGAILAVPEEDIPGAAHKLGGLEGVYPCYEGAAAYLGLSSLLRDGQIARDETAVLFNTGSGLINLGGPSPSLPTLKEPAEMHGHLRG